MHLISDEIIFQVGWNNISTWFIDCIQRDALMLENSSALLEFLSHSLSTRISLSWKSMLETSFQLLPKKYTYTFVFRVYLKFQKHLKRTNSYDSHNLLPIKVNCVKWYNSMYSFLVHLLLSISLSIRNAWWFFTI